MGVAGLCAFCGSGQSSRPTRPGKVGCLGVRKAQGLWPGPGRQRQLCKETRGPPVWGWGRSRSPSLSPFLSLTGRLVALLLGDEETQLSPATALDGLRASIVPASASGANVTPNEEDEEEDGDCDSWVLTSPLSLTQLRLRLGTLWGLPRPLLISFLI